MAKNDEYPGTTPSVEWDDAYLIGHTGIDDDHRYLFSLLNRLEAAISEGNGHLIISDILGDLGEYCGDHFNREEQVMKATRYFELEAHQKEHGQLIDALAELVYDFERGLSVEVRTLETVRNWLLHHVKTADLRLAEYLTMLPKTAKPDACQTKRRTL